MPSMRARPRLLALALAFALAFALAACSEEKTVPATQVVVSVHSNLEVGAQLSRVDVEVRDAARGKLVGTPRVFKLSAGKPDDDEVSLPFSFTVAKGEAERFRLDVIGYGPLGPNGALRSVIERKVVARFRTRETLLLQVFLDRACFDNVCTDASTCYPERERGVDAGDCGALPEPTLVAIDPGDESDVWSGKPTAPGQDAGQDDGGAAGRDGSAAGGNGGSAGTDPDAGERPDAGADAGTGEDGGALAGSGGSGGTGGSAGTGGTAGSSGTGGTGGMDGCVPTGETMFQRLAGDHVNEPQAPSAYNSRPPSSGMHCPDWGRWAEFTPQNPLSACHFLHNLEHGAVVLLYNCPSGCPELVELLRDVIADAPLDPNCSGLGIKRLLITPYADMEATLAATTWGYTWTSNCVDDQTHDELIAFITAHWGSNAAEGAPEPTVCEHGEILP